MVLLFMMFFIMIMGTDFPGVLQYTMKNVIQWSKKCPGKSVPIIIMKNIMKRSTMLIMFTMITIMITILTLNYTMLQNKEHFLLFQQQKIVHVQIKTEYMKK